MLHGLFAICHGPQPCSLIIRPLFIRLCQIRSSKALPLPELGDSRLWEVGTPIADALVNTAHNDGRRVNVNEELVPLAGLLILAIANPFLNDNAIMPSQLARAHEGTAL